MLRENTVQLQPVFSWAIEKCVVATMAPAVETRDTAEHAVMWRTAHDKGAPALRVNAEAENTELHTPEPRGAQHRLNLQTAEYLLGMKKETIQLCFLDPRICDLRISDTGLVRSINQNLLTFYMEETNTPLSQPANPPTKVTN